MFGWFIHNEATNKKPQLSKMIMETAFALAIFEFNDGSTGLKYAYSDVGLTFGSVVEKILFKNYKLRVT